MSESEKLKRCVDQAVQMLHERNKLLEAENSAYKENIISYRNDSEFYKQQSEFWASECISEQKKAYYALLSTIIGFAVVFVAIGAAILFCQ